MPTHYTIRIQFPLQQDPEVISAQLRRLVKSAPIDEIMFMIFCEEWNNGHETPEEIQRWMDHSRPYRQAVQAAGVATSLNPWHSLLHCDRSRKLKPQQKWQTMVDETGVAAEAVVCPMNPGWRQYFADSLRIYAKEGFRVVWVDDDIRLHNHAPVEWGCFCPDHVAEFNRRGGLQATREEIVSNCTAPGAPHPWRAMWMDMNEDLYCEMISQWREILEAEGTRLGLMSSAPESHAAEGRKWARWWKAFGGDKPPMHRPHFSGYSDMQGNGIPHSIAILDQNRMLQPQAVESGPEVENFPHNPWNKSYRQTASAMSLGQVMGATELNLSIWDYVGNDPGDQPLTGPFLSQWRPTHDFIADEFPMSLRSVGIGLPWSEDMGRRIHTACGGGWRSLVCPSRGWANWLGAAGHAFSMRQSAVINALAGPVVWSLDDDQLREILSHGTLVDGRAAAILVERGLGSLIGMTGGRFITQADRLYTVEYCTDPAFSLREGAMTTINGRAFAASLFQGDPVSSARVISDVRSPRNETVAHGVVLFENELGGKVAVMPYDANADVLMNIQRQTQLNKIIAWLDPGNAHGSVAGGAWLVPQFLADAERWRGAVWNGSPDEVAQLTVHAPAGMGKVRRAVQVDGNGERKEAQLDGERIILSQPMYEWDFVLLF